MCFHFQPCSAYSYILSPFKCQTPEYQLDLDLVKKYYTWIRGLKWEKVFIIGRCLQPCQFETDEFEAIGKLFI